ncbi:EAL domain-containing protein [uncultured Sphaerochaeta sp.]|uniref:EAL domain-containing protein n=1 Tax=uncultured Sphaerochaeta sp. TaxID=886478 RepID=UPI002A0A747A|nr:EAL domain-containing protein [uncultured Sphaerochaeta sp.]
MPRKNRFEVYILKQTKSIMVAEIVLIFLFVALLGYVVKITGGTKFVFSYSLYIPIMLGALCFGLPGGALTALVAGLVLGPFMPLDSSRAIMQPTINWVLRCTVYVSIGFLQGYIFSLMKNYMVSDRWKSKHNVDTGLENRDSMENAIQNLVISTVNPKTICNVSIFYVGNYDVILSTLGKDIADSLIAKIAQVLSAGMKDFDCPVFHIYREVLGSFHLGDYPTMEMMESWLNTLTASPIYIEGIPYLLDLHVGGANHAIEGLDASILLKRAQIASISAKQENKIFLLFKDEFEGTERQNLAILGSVPKAIEEDQFFLVFQPVIDAKDDSVVGVEALLRWNCPQLGYLTPSSFVTLVEQTPLIDSLQKWVLEKALESLGLLNKEFPFLHCSINLSANTLQDGKIADFVQSLIISKNLKAENILFEVTETAVMVFPALAIETLQKLKDLGCKIALDDFGTGLSSLAYLEYIPAELVKLDKLFVDKLPYSEHTRIFVTEIVKFSKNLGLEVTAEGVDSQRKVQLLRDSGCDFLQGYYFSKPLSLDQLQVWIRESEKENPKQKPESRMQ